MPVTPILNSPFSILECADATLAATEHLDRRAGAAGPGHTAWRHAGAGDPAADLRRRSTAWPARAAPAERDTLLQRPTAGERRAGAGQRVDHQPGRAAGDRAAGGSASAAARADRGTAAHAHHNRAGRQRGARIHGGRRSADSTSFPAYRPACRISWACFTQPCRCRHRGRSSSCPR